MQLYLPRSVHGSVFMAAKSNVNANVKPVILAAIFTVYIGNFIFSYRL
jgi:hypothetical protein